MNLQSFYTKKKNMLSYQLLVAILICSSILTLLTSGIQLFFDYRKDVKIINENIQLIQESYLPAIISSLYSFDNSQLDILLEGVFNIIHIEYVEIKDKTNKMNIHKGVPSKKFEITREFTLNYNKPNGEIDLLGTIIISASFKGIYSRLFEKAFVIIISNMIKTFLAAILIFMIIKHLVIRHIVKITNYLKKTDVNTLDQPLHLSQNLDKKNELSLLKTAINQMNNELYQKINALKNSEERYRTLVDNIPGSTYRCRNDKHWTMDFISNEVEKHSGYPVSDFIQNQVRSFASIIHPEDRKLVEDNVENAIRTKHRFTIEYRIIRADGTISWVFEKGQAQFDDNGKVICLEGVLIDSTMYKQVVEEKDKLKEQLRQSEKLKAIGQLAGGIAHDFNNQLGGIVGYAEIIKDEVSNNVELTHYVDNLLTGTKRASDLINQLLAFSRKGKYLTVPVDMHSILHEVVELLKHSIDKKVVIQLELKASPSLTFGDPTQLQNAILNMAINSRDAMPDGGKLILETENVSITREFCKSKSIEIESGTYLKLSVIDTGVGMDEKTIGRIFEPFYTTKEVGKGTGMGLAAVYGTVKNHNGTICVTSEPGLGSTFEIYLPLVSEDNDLANKGKPVQKSTDDTAHILIVEDEEMLREVASQILKRIGYSIAVSENGLSAIEYYKNNWKTIDLVILDVVMPKMNGEETFFAMKAINPNVNVLVASGYSLENKAQNIINNGAKDFIQKPFRKAELLNKVSDILKINK